tara:strand:- start:616 stop:2223 length:1608 start_codon:yes stop_codon:yes gene_type:complete
MKNKIINTIKDALKSINYPIVNISIEKPKNKKNGDVSSNIAFLLSKELKQNPLDIANKLKDILSTSELFQSVSVANPGFINFKFNVEAIIQNIHSIIKLNTNYGKNNSGKNEKVLVEFVSANPTGPLTVGHGRGAIIGDTISNILSWNGYDVHREYYYNNAGRQMRVLGESLKARCYEQLNQKYSFPEDGYKGDYLINIAKDLNSKFSIDLLNKSNEFYIKNAEKYIFKEIKSTLKKLGLKFDSFFNEHTLYENKDIYTVIEKLKDKKLIYKKDDATWFKATAVGLNADRVLIKKTGEPTYRLPDIAYHATKFDRGYNLCIDVFGADHMDAYPDVLAALKQLGYNDNKVKVLIHQFVSIIKDGEAIKMSTRLGNFTTLNQLIKDIGADVVRYFFIMRSINSHLNFDLELAKQKSENNPVYYIQYAYARISTILNKINNDSKSNLILLKHNDEIQLIHKLIEFEELIIKLKEKLEPQILANYLFDLATLFHKYYAHHKIIGENKELSKARVTLIQAIQIVIKNGLNILGISHPERM